MRKLISLRLIGVAVVGTLLFANSTPVEAVSVVAGRVCISTANGTPLSGASIYWSTAQAKSQPVTSDIRGCSAFQAIPIGSVTVTYSLGSNFDGISGTQTIEVVVPSNGRVTVSIENLLSQTVCLGNMQPQAYATSTVSWAAANLKGDTTALGADGCITFPKVPMDDARLTVVPKYSGVGYILTGQSFSQSVSFEHDTQITIPALEVPEVQTRSVAVQMPDGTPVPDAIVTFQNQTKILNPQLDADEPEDPRRNCNYRINSTGRIRPGGPSCMFLQYYTVKMHKGSWGSTSIVSQLGNKSILNTSAEWNEIWLKRYKSGHFWTVGPTSQSISANFTDVFLPSSELDEIQCETLLNICGGVANGRTYLGYGSALSGYSSRLSVEATVSLSALGFTQETKQTLNVGRNIVELPYMAHVADVPAGDLTFSGVRPVVFTVKAVNSAKRPLKNQMLSLQTTSSSRTRNGCKSVVSGKTDSSGKLKFTLCLTKSSVVQVKGKGLISSRKIRVIKR